MATPTLLGANQYHEERLGKEQWESVDEDKRNRAITTAIDDLGSFLSYSKYEYAVYEQALWLVSGSEAEYARLGVSSIKIDDLSKSYDRGNRPTNISPKAWQLLTGSGSGLSVRAGEIPTRPMPRCVIGRRFFHVF